MDELIAHGINYTYENSFSHPFVSSPLLMPLLLSVLRDQSFPRYIDNQPIKEEYDFIIVGAGAAGSTLANRLSEDGSKTVLLLEAGPVFPLMTEVPGASGTWYGSALDWRYRTVPQENTAFGVKDRQMPFPAGKTVGGSTTINGMQFVRGNHHNFDQWEEMGAKGWSYKDVLPYFKKMEDNQNPEYVKSGYHGTGGPVTVLRGPYEPELTAPVLSAAKSFGYRIGDSNGAEQTGFYPQQSTMRNGKRCSASKAYLVPAENRTNLNLVTDAYVTQIEVKDGKATGVLFDQGCQKGRSVRARLEVIVSAGAINTPQLLMLSGIGPETELEDLGIPTHANLPVGKNLMDHPGSFLHYTWPDVATVAEKLGNPDIIQEYIQNRTGPLATSAGNGALAFLLHDEVAPEVDFPNYQLYFKERDADANRGLINMTDEVYKAYLEPHKDKAFIICTPALVQPKSRGTVTLHSTDPYDPSLVDPKFYSDPRDIEDLVEGMRTCQKILSSPELREVGAREIDRTLPGCEDSSSDDDDFFRCLIRYLVFSYSHQSGTARMGRPDDPDTVVDPRLRVKGIGNLRVVDASVMPVVTSGNTMTTVYMVAEKAADIIKEDHGIPITKVDNDRDQQ